MQKSVSLKHTEHNEASHCFHMTDKNKHVYAKMRLVCVKLPFERITSLGITCIAFPVFPNEQRQIFKTI